jgi:hypothetical protein
LDKDARIAELTTRLAIAEAELAAVRSKAVPELNELVIPVEALANLIYVTKHSAKHPQRVTECDLLPISHPLITGVSPFCA